jgi:carbon storage regulator
MLVLSRKVGESIIINGCIKVTICKAEAGKVRIGIDAPPEVPVHREEIFRALSEFAEPEFAAAH